MYYSNFDYMRSDDDYTDFQDEDFETACPFYFCPLAYQTRDFMDMTRVNPPGPPPTFTPAKPSTAAPMGGPSLKAIDPGAIRRCMNRFVYIWETNGRSYWAFITFVGPRSISGFRWIPRTRRWVYFGLDLRRIESFFCA